MPSQTKIPAFPWDGGKSKLAPDILKFVPHRGRKFIDLFAGRGNIVLRAIHDGLDYEDWVVNDILTAPFFRALRDYGDNFVAEDCTHECPQQVYDRCERLAKQGDPYGLLMEPYVCFNGGTYATNGKKGLGGGRRRPDTYMEMCRLACQFLREKRVKITDLDWLNCLQAEKPGPDDTVIVDAPYLGCDVGPYDAESICPTELIEHLKSAPFRWILCEYRQPLYVSAFGEPALQKDVQLRAAQLRDVRKSRTECIWVHEPNAGRTVTVTVPEVRNDAYYKSLSVEALLKEIQECIGAITYCRNQMNREMRERLLPALLELRKRTYRKKPGFYESLAKIGLNADTVRQWFYRSNTADEAVELLEETPPESVRREHNDGQSPEELLLEHADRMAKAILAGKLTHAKKLASQYLETRNEGQVRTEPEAA
jgi:hypothetical protein